jgi:hypothetical protein
VTEVVQSLNGTVPRIHPEDTSTNGTNSNPATRLIRTLWAMSCRVGPRSDRLILPKIIVTVERTGWEDHYRLYCLKRLLVEDPWRDYSHLPAQSRRTNGNTIYSTNYLEHPQERLTIARKGWQLAIYGTASVIGPTTGWSGSFLGHH